MDIRFEYDWSNLPDGIDWFVFCIKGIDIWLNNTYQGNGKCPIWSDDKWIKGINKWLVRNRYTPVRPVKGSSLHVPLKELEKARSSDLGAIKEEATRKVHQATKEAQELYDADPTVARDMNLGIKRDRTRDEAMQEIRRRIQAGEINQRICEDIRADEELLDLLELIVTSGYYEKLMRGDYERSGQL